MRRLFILILALIPICAFSQYDPNRFSPMVVLGRKQPPQEKKEAVNESYDYDKYIPKEYSPMKYQPQRTIQLEIFPYQEKHAGTTVMDLYEMLVRARHSPEIISQFKGDWQQYVKLIEKYNKKGKLDEDVRKKKAMLHYQEDWTTVDRFFYEKECESKRQAREKSIKDSIYYRNLFVDDSLRYRKSFVSDSILARKHFVEDSLYRADYRKKGNYDYVEFDGPHGKPGLCYRKGKIVDGKTYNVYGLEEKVYENGIVIHDFSYSDGYLVMVKKKEDNEAKDGTWIYDSVDNVRWNYSDVNSLYSKEKYDSEGLLVVIVNYKNNEPEETHYYSYYPDKERIKQKIVIERHPSYKSLGDCTIYDYYSDGTLKQSREYMTRSDGPRVLRRVRIPKDGYSIIEYYDYDGKLERRETKTAMDYNPFYYYY